MTATTTVVITRATRRRLAVLQALIALEGGGHVDVDTAVNRALDRSDQLGSLIRESGLIHPNPETT